MPAAPPRPLVTSPRPSADDPEAPLARRSPYSKWRAGTLILVYVLMAAHIVHWQLAEKTLAPLELHEVMFTAELGIVTAGFLFMALSIVLTGVFGRFFCGWGCHLMALQDLCAWLLAKAGIRHKPIRARLIAWAPFLVMAYMFVLPQILRIAAGEPHPGFRFADDSEPIASFTTSNFWRNLPDPWIATATFVVCGFLAIYVLGSRGFCTYACPYGVVFRFMDRLAPGRIRLVGTCEQCGTCTKVCTSGIQVHDQIRTYGAVVDPRCMKDLDCVGACPHDSLGFRFGKPALFQKALPGHVMPARKYDFTLGEELLMAGMFAATLFVFRGLYDQVPFLMSVGLGAISAYAAVVCLRLLRPGEVKLGRIVLKGGNGLRSAGRAFAIAAALFYAFFAHSAVVQFSLWRGHAAYAVARELPATQGLARKAAADRALDYLETVDRWSLFATAEAKMLLAWVTAMHGDRARAERLIADAVAVDPRSAEARYWLAGFLAQRGDQAGAITHLRVAVESAPRHAGSHARLGQLLCEQGDEAAGQAELAKAAQLDPRYASQAGAK
jgi:Flp pilus assembly protein TadD